MDNLVRKVLKALPNASGPDLARLLRQAALALSASADSSHWIGSDLLPAVLSALRSLPGGRTPVDAVEACAAATSVLANLFVGLRLPRHRDALLAALAADAEACRALARWGIACPEAAQQLPPGREAHMNHDVLSVPAGVTNSPRHPFWTPMSHCATFLTALVTSTEPGGHNSRLQSHFREAVTPGVVERLLTLAIRFPCCTPWSFLQILCYANHAAAVEAAEQHLALLLRAIGALRIELAAVLAAHPSDHNTLHRLAYAARMIKAANTLCGAHPTSPTFHPLPIAPSGPAVAPKNALGVMLAALDVALAVLGDLHQIDAVGTPLHSVQLKAYETLVRLHEQVADFLTRSMQGRPRAKARLAAALLKRERLVRWWASLRTMRSAEAAMDAVSLLLEAITADIPMGGGKWMSGGLQMSEEQAAEVLELLLGECRLGVLGCLQTVSDADNALSAAAALQGRTALLLKFLAQGCGVPGPSLARCMLQFCPDMQWAGMSQRLSMLDVELVRKLELSADAGVLDNPEVAALAGQAECRILGQLICKDAMSPVDDMIQLLMDLESPPVQLTPQQTSTCRVTAILAIGAHIQGKPLAWMTHLLPQPVMWEYVGSLSRRDIDGLQLQRMHQAAQLQRQSGSRDAAQEAECVAQVQRRFRENSLVPMTVIQQEQPNVAAHVVTQPQDKWHKLVRVGVLRLCARTDPRHWLQNGGAPLVAIYTSCPDPETKQAALQAVMHALLAAQDDPTLRATRQPVGPGVRMQPVADLVLGPMIGQPLPPFHWTTEALEVSEPLDLDTWLVAAAQKLVPFNFGGQHDEELPRALARCTGWEALRAWSVREAARLRSIRRVVEVIAGRPELFRDGGLGRMAVQWLEEWDDASDGVVAPAAADRASTDSSRRNDAVVTTGAAGSAATAQAAVPAPRQRLCGQCGAAGAAMLCGGCKQSRYCNPTCQKAHWKAHRPQCKELRRQQAGAAAAAASAAAVADATAL